MADQLVGKVAMITGGGSGIGYQLCLGLAREGADIAVCDLNREGAEAAAAAVRALGRRAEAIEVDVSQSESVARAVQQVLTGLGAIDILVNCAGIFPRHPFLEFSEEEWRRVIDVNLTGTYLCCRAVADYMVGRRSGKIVNIASGRGVTGAVNGAHYAASKGGIIALTVSLGMELGPYGINVNAVAPGATDTPLLRGYREPGWQPARDNVPVNRRTEGPEEVIGPVLFLVTDASRTFFGQTIFMKQP